MTRPTLSGSPDQPRSTFPHSKEAHDAALPGEIIQAWGVEFTENLPVSKSIIIKGGYDQDYTIMKGRTGLKGKFSIMNGKAVVENLEIR